MTDSLYRRIHGFGHLRADCRGPGSSLEPYALTTVQAVTCLLSLRFLSNISHASHRGSEALLYRRIFFKYMYSNFFSQFPLRPLASSPTQQLRTLWGSEHASDYWTMFTFASLQSRWQSGSHPASHNCPKEQSLMAYPLKEIGCKP